MMNWVEFFKLFVGCQDTSYWTQISPQVIVQTARIQTTGQINQSEHTTSMKVTRIHAAGQFSESGKDLIGFVAGIQATGDTGRLVGWA